jgi:hypothetical protein
MIFKTKYDLSLNEVSRMFETNDITILCKYRFIPARFALIRFSQFMVEFSEMFNRDEVNELLVDDIQRLKITNRVYNILAAMYQGLLMTGDQRFKDLYKETFGRDYNSLADLKVIISEIDRLKGKLKELGSPTKIQGKGTISFEQIITYVEMILDRSIDREMKLYQFKYQYDLAVKRAAEYAKMKSNG